LNFWAFKNQRLTGLRQVQCIVTRGLVSFF
jgi:hypothetical protein